MSKNYFASNLRFLRIKLGLRQEDLAKLINKDRSLIGHWENQKREPTLEDVLNIADFFDVSFGDLITTDLRLKKEYPEEKEKIELEFLRKALIRKGYLKDGEDLSDENFNKLVEIAKLLK